MVSQTIGSTYNWIVIGSSIIAGQGTNAVQIFWGNAGMGHVAVIETDAMGCVGDTVTLAVQIGTSSGITSYVTSEELLIYPNPFNQSTRVVFSNQEKAEFELVIYDLLGHKVRMMKDITTNVVTIEKSNLTTGVYFIELQGEAKIFRARIMVE